MRKAFTLRGRRPKVGQSEVELRFQVKVPGVVCRIASLVLDPVYYDINTSFAFREDLVEELSVVGAIVDIRSEVVAAVLVAESDCDSAIRGQ